tara:strand:- start:2353 stop:2979 length:627 start_codon:yes stop_codon:yes gene_type:complete
MINFIKEVKMIKAALYCRVSTSDQKTEMQLADIRKFAKDRGFRIFNEYIDSGVSGSIKSRPALDSLMSDAKKKKFDVILVWRFDRFARSTKHLVEALHTFKHLGIDFISYQENIDTSSPLGEAIFTIISAMAQLERDIIRERVKAGLRNARSKGRTLGRPKAKFDIDEVKMMQGEGVSLRNIGIKLNVDASTLCRRINTIGENCRRAG